MQAAPHLLHLFHKQPQLLVEASGSLGNLAGILVLPLVAPQVLYGPQRHHQIGGAHQQDVVVEPVAYQGRVGLQRGEEGRLHRHKHQHIVEGTHPGQLLVILAAQLADMVAHRGDVLLERYRFFQRVIGVVPALVGGQRHLGVYDDVFLLRQVDDHVGLIALALVQLDIDLGMVLVALTQTAFTEDAGQYHLPPVTLLLAVPLEGAGQGRRLFGHAGVEFGQTLQFELEAVTLGRLLGMGFSHLATEAFQLLFQRCQQQIQTVLVQVAKVTRVLLENTIGEVFKLLAETLFPIPLQLQLLGGGQSLAAQGGFGILEAGSELDEQGLLLIQLLLTLHPLILQFVEAILQRLMALLGQQQLLLLGAGKAAPCQPADTEGEQGCQQRRPPGRQRDHLRLR